METEQIQRYKVGDRLTTDLNLVDVVITDVFTDQPISKYEYTFKTFHSNETFPRVREGFLIEKGYRPIQEIRNEKLNGLLK